MTIIETVLCITIAGLLAHLLGIGLIREYFDRRVQYDKEVMRAMCEDVDVPIDHKPGGR